MGKKNIIRIVEGFLILAFSFLSWASLAGALNGGPDWVQKSIWSLAAFLFLGISVGLVYLIENQRILFFGLPALIVLPALVFLKNDLLSGAVLTAVLFFLALAAWRTHFEKSLRIELAPCLILKRGLGSFITALALTITLFFYWAPYAQSLGNDIRIPRPLFDSIARPAIEMSLALSLPRGTNPKSLSPEFTKQQTAILDNLYLSANEQLSVAGKTFKKWIPLGVSVSLFFSFKVIGTFLSWLMIVLAWLIFKILLWGGIIKIEKVAVEKEIVVV